MLYSFDDADAADRHETQYFEMFGNRGIYHKGWTAVTKHKTPWLLVQDDVPAFDDDVWELYDHAEDWSQARDVAEQFPELCEAEQQEMSEVLGTHVQRLATIVNGDCACTTHVPLVPAER